MKIVVYGLGIIGASLATALKKSGHHVLGKNRSRGALEVALSRGMIDGETATYEGADVVFLALPLGPTLAELEAGVFPEGTIVCDICGVKKVLEDAVQKRPRAYRYIGAHPMAGKETSGIASSDPALFCGKNLVLTVNGSTDPAALATVESLARDVGFGRIVHTSAAEHDRKIALTSQLAHVVSNAYIQSSEAKGSDGFTGGSFQDMTRVGGVDETLWKDLYFANRENLIREIGGLCARLERYAEALRSGDEEALLRLLKAGRLAHGAYFSEK